MAAMLLSGGGGKEGGLWDGTSADPNGVNPEANNGEPSTPSSTDGAAASASAAATPVAAAGNPSGSSDASAGVLSTCPACTKPRVSRIVTCQGCHKIFHWVCMGFYEHKYQQPGPNWRCKKCKVVEAPPHATGKGVEASPAPPAMEEVQSPDSGEMIDVGEDAPPSTTPPEAATLGATIPGRPGGSLAAVLATPIALGTADAAAATAAVPTSTPAGIAAPAATVASPMCPACGKGLGRKRTLDCSVCHTPWHALCAGVRGAETPKGWICRNCKPAARAAAAGTSPTHAAATIPPVAAAAAGTSSTNAAGTSPPVAAEAVSLGGGGAR